MQIKLVAARQKEGITSKEMAAFLGISNKQYSRKETGYVDFTMTELFRLASRFNMRIEDLFIVPDFMNHEERRA